MKKILLSSALLMLFLTGNGQPSITHLNYPSSVNLFDLFEISFKMGLYSNPYDPDTISVYAVFTGPGNRCDTVIGFYYEGYTFQKEDNYEKAYRDPLSTGTGWRIRFTPDAIGFWEFCIHAIDRHGETLLCSNKAIPYCFNCLSVSNAKGFITKANSRYLKRDVVENNSRQYHSYYPVGPNIAWYSCKDSNYEKPYGIYGYERYIDSLSGNGNYMRIWLNRYQYLNLYGPEYTQKENGNPIVYFDSLINQKDAAELDYIITYAAQNDISLMLCFFSFGDFSYNNPDDPNDPSVWINNPYNNLLVDPCLFFDNAAARRVSKNLIRYIVARWGYATNIMSWELWNEVTNMPCVGNKSFEEDVFYWHKIMSDYIRAIDPFKHCISTSMSHYSTYPGLFSDLYMYLDIVQKHDYQNINKAKSKEQFSKVLLNLSNNAHAVYPIKPFFIGEFAFGFDSLCVIKDPHGIDLHNSLWSSLFSTSMGPGSFWRWHYLKTQGLFNRFRPILTFCQNLPILSDSFEAYTTGKDTAYLLVFPNNIETYYMMNKTEDTIYGWSQDTAFAYQSLRWLTDSVIPANYTNGLHFVDTVVFDPDGYVYTLYQHKKPHPSSNSNIIKIPISDVSVGTQYEIHWFNSETGLEYSNSITYTSVQQDAQGNKWIVISFPSTIRNLNNLTITNTFGDVVFAIYQNNTKERKKNKKSQIIINFANN